MRYVDTSTPEVAFKFATGSRKSRSLCRLWESEKRISMYGSVKIRSRNPSDFVRSSWRSRSAVAAHFNTTLELQAPGLGARLANSVGETISLDVKCACLQFHEISVRELMVESLRFSQLKVVVRTVACATGLYRIAE